MFENNFREMLLTIFPSNFNKCYWRYFQLTNLSATTSPYNNIECAQKHKYAPEDCCLRLNFSWQKNVHWQISISFRATAQQPSSANKIMYAKFVLNAYNTGCRDPRPIYIQQTHCGNCVYPMYPTVERVIYIYRDIGSKKMTEAPRLTQTERDVSYPRIYIQVYICGQAVPFAHVL